MNLVPESSTLYCFQLQRSLSCKKTITIEDLRNQSSPPGCNLILCQFVAFAVSINVRKYETSVLAMKEHARPVYSQFAAPWLCTHMARERRSTAAHRGHACCAVRSTELFWDVCLTSCILIWLQESMVYLAVGRCLKQIHSNEGTSVAPGSARQVRRTFSFN